MHNIKPEIHLNYSARLTLCKIAKELGVHPSEIGKGVSSLRHEMKAERKVERSAARSEKQAERQAKRAEKKAERANGKKNP